MPGRKRRINLGYIDVDRSGKPKNSGLSETNAGIAVGLITGLCLFLLGLSAAFLSYGNLYVLVLSSMLPGFDASIIGSFIGLFWGFVSGFITAYLIVWVYNRL
ncbi:MAG: hypothetical protein M1594_02360 [Candidatus Marsarchaeota archaeon]|nr:hypothetical protein [Candidatus Marsarchaeota archaeon]